MPLINCDGSRKFWTVAVIAMTCAGCAQRTAISREVDTTRPTAIARSTEPRRESAQTQSYPSRAPDRHLILSRPAGLAAPLTGEPAMGDMFEVRHISVSIDRPPSKVYSFISKGENLPQWATGLGNKFRRVGDEWLAEGPLGTVKVRLARPNDFGVADQDVVFETGVTVRNPIRVVPNGTGSTVTFTLMRLAGVSEQKFNDDAKWVERDLTTLKAVLEKP
jgi:hypothetical protein